MKLGHDKTCNIIIVIYNTSFYSIRIDINAIVTIVHCRNVTARTIIANEITENTNVATSTNSIFSLYAQRDCIIAW